MPKIPYSIAEPFHIFCPKPNAIAYLHTLPKLYPILIHCHPILIHLRTYTPSKTLTNLYPILIHCRNIPYLNTWLVDPSRPWAWYMGGLTPPHLISSHSYCLPSTSFPPSHFCEKSFYEIENVFFQKTLFLQYIFFFSNVQIFLFFPEKKLINSAEITF